MKLGYNTKSKDPTYYVQMGVRNGKKVTTKNIARIGKHSDLLEITDDPLAYAKEQVAKYNEKAKNNKTVELEIRFDFAEKIKHSEKPVSESTLRNIGYLYLQEIYNQLGIDRFFSLVTRNRRITFSPDLVNRFMTYSRILDPDSKLGSFEKLHTYYEEPSFGYHHILRTMDLMCEHYDQYISHLFTGSGRIHKRNTAVCYYDCTNFCCEAEVEDEDYVDEVTGEILTGLRQYGYSKDHKPSPLVEMGLFMDTDGIPISMCIAPGNTSEQSTVLPLERELLKMLDDGHKRFVYCADAGLCTYDIRHFNSMGGRAFVVTQSVKKLSDTLQKAVFNDYGYRRLSDNTPCSVAEMKGFDRHDERNRRLYNDRVYKVIEADKLTDVGLYEVKAMPNGRIRRVKSKALLKQHVIITFSRKSMEYQRFVRNGQVERAKKILNGSDPDSYKKGPNDVMRFIKKVSPGKDKYVIDTDRIAEEEKYDGFYAIATNLDDDVKDVIAINEQRYKIEDCFRILKTDFVSSPYFHRTRERIIAHFMICYTALLIFRLLEVKLRISDKNTHVTARNIIETLNNMKVANISDLVYSSQYTGSQTLSLLEGAFGLGLNMKQYLPKDLNKKCKKTKPHQ